MSVHTRAPQRIDFAGGWSDVAAFADREGGTVVNAAVEVFVHVDFLMGGQAIRLHAEDLGEHLTIPSSGHVAYDGRLDLHKAALNMLPVTGGIEILSRSDAPSGAGLGGSGALDVALLAGLACCREEAYERRELAELGYQLETGELKLFGGKQDQYAAALGGFLRLDFLDGSVQARQLAVSEEAARELAAHLVLIYTGESHFSSRTHARVWDAYQAGDRHVADAIRSIREVARETDGALEAGDWPRLANLVHANWEQQQRLDATMATPATVNIERAVREAGAWGLKATGAGAGGCLVALGPVEKGAAIAGAARAEGGRVLPFEFANEGVRVWQEEDLPYDA